MAVNKEQTAKKKEAPSSAPKSKRSAPAKKKAASDKLPEVAGEEIVAREHLVANGGPQKNGKKAASREEIAVRAFEIWQENGCPSGCDEEHWMQAESEMRS